MKTKKAADEDKLTNEMILEGGDEMVNSITYMFREISVTQQIPNQWKTMRMKSIHKKGSKFTFFAFTSQKKYKRVKSFLK